MQPLTMIGSPSRHLAQNSTSARPRRCSCASYSACRVIAAWLLPARDEPAAGGSGTCRRCSTRHGCQPSGAAIEDISAPTVASSWWPPLMQCMQTHRVVRSVPIARTARQHHKHAHRRWAASYTGASRYHKGIVLVTAGSPTVERLHSGHTGQAARKPAALVHHPMLTDHTRSATASHALHHTPAGPRTRV